MSPEQRKILRPVFKSVAHHNQYVWWELKREIFDRGYQSQYQWELEFVAPAGRALEGLSDLHKSVLVAHWTLGNKDDVVRSDDQVLGIYIALVVEEVVRRAAIASSRTHNW